MVTNREKWATFVIKTVISSNKKLDYYIEWDFSLLFIDRQIKSICFPSTYGKIFEILEGKFEKNIENWKNTKNNMEAGANIDAMLDEFLSGEFENKAVCR